MVATGKFDVVLKPITGAEASIGTMSIDKTFEGDLRARSVGQMLAIRTPQEGSAGYVAMERVTGTLDGRHGSFALQHTGTMDPGAQTASVTVVPDSGTEGFERLAGTMVIDGNHNYTFNYTLPV